MKTWRSTYEKRKVWKKKKERRQDFSFHDSYGILIEHDRKQRLEQNIMKKYRQACPGKGRVLALPAGRVCIFAVQGMYEPVQTGKWERSIIYPVFRSFCIPRVLTLLICTVLAPLLHYGEVLLEPAQPRMLRQQVRFSLLLSFPFLIQANLLSFPLFLATGFEAPFSLSSLLPLESSWQEEKKRRRILL